MRTRKAERFYISHVATTSKQLKGNREQVRKSNFNWVVFFSQREYNGISNKSTDQSIFIYRCIKTKRLK